MPNTGGGGRKIQWDVHFQDKARLAAFFFFAKDED